MWCSGIRNTVLSLSKDGCKALVMAAWLDKLTAAGQRTAGLAPAMAATEFLTTGEIEMASIRKEIVIGARPETIWDAVRDVGALHTRLVPGFVVDCRLEEGARVVTFANGLVARELIVDIDDAACRLVWSVVEGRPIHHNGSLQVFAEQAGRSRVVWVADILPHDLAGPIGGMMDHGMHAMKQTLEGANSAGAAA
jgi:hypothetical protein